ncbi:MAG: hypothetical protein HY892_09855 [Deltaproteobacteria bacterium]|nr:hypothetical protein [Deltaproteobacteria bacterium]
MILLGAFLLSPTSLPAAQTLQILLQESGGVYWETPFPETASFILRHCNSIYEAWVEERFQADRQGRIRLTGVKTSSPAVLEYYGLEASSADWVSLSRPFDRLSLLVSRRGRVSLLADQESLPLSESLPDGTRIEIRVLAAPE